MLIGVRCRLNNYTVYRARELSLDLRGSGLCVEAGEFSVVEFSVSVLVEALEQAENLVWREAERIFTEDHRRLVYCKVSVAVQVESREGLFEQLLSTTRKGKARTTVGICTALERVTSQWRH